MGASTLRENREETCLHMIIVCVLADLDSDEAGGKVVHLDYGGCGNDLGAPEIDSWP